MKLLHALEVFTEINEINFISIHKLTISPQSNTSGHFMYTWHTVTPLNY